MLSEVALAIFGEREKKETKMSVKQKTRQEKRNERAELVCREVRYQMVTYGGIADNTKLYKLLFHWMKVANNDKYKRPL